MTTRFLAKNDRNISERYLLHRAIQSHKAMLQYLKYQDVANLKPFDEHDAREIRKIRDHVITEHGKEMIHDWGWAAPAVGNNKPTFLEIESSLNLDHWRPRYRWATQDTHGGYRPPAVLLGLSEAKEPLLLVGPSNSGLTDPVHMTAISLVLATSALTDLSPTIDRLVTTQIMLTLSDEIGEVFFKIDLESSQGIQCG